MMSQVLLPNEPNEKTNRDPERSPFVRTNGFVIFASIVPFVYNEGLHAHKCYPGISLFPKTDSKPGIISQTMQNLLVN